MLLDHFNTLFLSPLRPELYALGRAAFPLFSLIWAINVNRKPERLQFQANRLWLWAVVTQPVFMLAFRQLDPWYALNILFVFAGTTQLLAWPGTDSPEPVASPQVQLCWRYLPGHCRRQAMVCRAKF
ncbi:TraX family protein [Cronobacter turicensis]